MIIISVALMLLMALYSTLEGIREAWYYNEKMTSNPVLSIIPNEHKLFSIQRGIFVLILSALNMIALDSFWVLFLSVLAYSLVFPFFHDGAYYRERNRLNFHLYPKGWFDQKDSNDKDMKTAALFNPSPKLRTIMCLIGISTLLVMIYCQS